MFKSVSLSAKAPAQAVVVGVFTDKKLDRATAALDARYGRVITQALKRAECSGDSGKVWDAYPPGGGTATKPARVLILGLGKRNSFDASSLRAGAAAVGRRLAATKDERVAIELHGAVESAKGDAAVAGRCFGEGLGLIAWNFEEFKGKGSENGGTKSALSIRSSSKAFQDGVQRGLHLAESTNLARDLSQTPPNVATTEFMADQARKLAKKTGMSCRVWKGAELEKENFAGLINVGKASENKPCLIRLEYSPKRKTGAKPVVLVGKTMTYDSGGLSLKINNGMVGMKRDKDGGCAVLGAMHAIASYIKPERPVVALLACAENSISDEAYRPDDVIRYRNGVTVEVTNTDAEGRLVLADALCWACEHENPECIIDLATLTGGVVVALGSTFAGLWCDHDDLRRRLEAAMRTSGERWWRLPHDAEYRDMMKSPIADILNSNPNRKAHPIQGAAFLSYFVTPGVPWCHIDIAGVHAVEGDTGPFIKGPTGWGVRLLADLMSQK
ncbi:MAG: M17 family metallopeptidase [Phycisphaerales bacterium]